MPALRKSARERDSRSHNHRLSATPYASPNGTPAASTGDKKQRSITEWTEPQPQQLTPSFEEHGFARHGVLENMAPLGVPPKAKDKQRARTLGEAAARSPFLGKPAAAFGEDVGSTPEMTPAPELEPDDSEKQEEDEVQVHYAVLEEDEDDDYEPIKTKKKGKGAKTPVRGKTPVQSRTPVHGKTPAKNGHGKSASVSASPAVQAVQAPEPVGAAAQRMLIAINEAISQANKKNQRSISVALKEIHEMSMTDVYISEVLESMLRQDPTVEQYAVFRRHVKAIKKRVKREIMEQELEERNGHGAAHSTRRTSVRASSEIVPDDSASAVHDLKDQQLFAPSAITPKETATKTTHRALQSALENRSEQPSTHPFSTAPALPAAETSTESTPRMPSKSPRKRASKTNGHLAPDSEMDIDGPVSTTAPTPAAKTPDTGASDSELSEVNEEIVQKGPPEPIHTNGKESTPVPTASKGKNLAQARAAKKAKGKPIGKHAYKPQPQTAEQQAEDDHLWEMRNTMAEQQPIRNLANMVPPISDVRFDDEILETESLTESQIAVGPPVDSDQPRRAGRIPHHGTKRLREDTSRFSSPQLDSAAATRPSTPAVGPVPKRIKLTNGQGARTKRSPVKNRDAGPIAGVAFNGGGVSRQLGPDDNNPNSPQSDSDDFCSACRGPGEFVCCEGCPRVFHLLCCDPPRVEVPDGAFYCHECSAKRGFSDDSSAETFTILGPLFKSLERINPRAFALPRDIQTNFEGISARNDGSYFEEIRKFPLSKNGGYGYQRPDYTKVFDSDQKPILCAQCGKSSGHKRQLLKCDFCHAHWHLDCVDPPLANPPHISLEASQRDAWRCPRHIEHDFRSGLLLQNDLNDPDYDVDMVDAAPAVRVTRRVRKRKQPEVVEPTFSRGMRNNGLIEIMNDPEEETDGEGNYVFGPDDSRDLSSKVFRVPEKGVILDFISKVKSGRVEKRSKAQAKSKAGSQNKASMQNFLAHSVQQQQAALALAQFARKETDIDLGEGKITALILGLSSEAPADVITAIDNAGPAPPTEIERAELLRLQELIERRLKA